MSAKSAGARQSACCPQALEDFTHVSYRPELGDNYPMAPTRATGEVEAPGAKHGDPVWVCRSCYDYRPAGVSAPLNLEVFQVVERDRYTLCEGHGEWHTQQPSTQKVCEQCPEAGWYWWTCSPGCLPDSDAAGPFATEAEALADAQDD